MCQIVFFRSAALLRGVFSATHFFPLWIGLWGHIFRPYLQYVCLAPLPRALTIEGPFPKGLIKGPIKLAPERQPMFPPTLDSHLKRTCRVP